MDKKESRVEEDVNQILKTRVAMADKLESLEQRVDETIQETKTTALNLIGYARDTAADVVGSTTQLLNPALHARRRPWIFIGGAIGIVLIAGWMEKRRKASSVIAYYPPEAESAEVMPPAGEKSSQRRNGVFPFYTTNAPKPSGNKRPSRQEDAPWELLKPVSALLETVTGDLAKEYERLRGAVLLTGRSFTKDLTRIVVWSLIDALVRPRREERGQHARPIRTTR